MRMIPSSPHATRSRAELRVFDRLRAAFANGGHQGDLQLTAFHSLNVTRHATQRFGEIDFLIVGRPGIFVLEVKGGGIACHNGHWSTTNRSGETKELHRSPFKQAADALHGLMNKVRGDLPDVIWQHVPNGYGVILPDCNWTQAGAEWEPAMIADTRSLRNMERWLTGFFDLWRKQNPWGGIKPDDEALHQLKAYLRPDFEVAVPLHVRLDELEERVASLTQDQMWMVDVADNNPRVLCSGGAGTGKTFLALELARRWATHDQKVLLACRSPWLKRWLESRFLLPGVSVALANAATMAARRAGIDRYDAMIVDEGQDLLDLGILDTLDGVLEGGLEEGRWCFFHDTNNQSGYFGKPDPDALALLDSCRPARVPVTINCRNTRQILTKVQATLGADMGVNGSGDGPEVREFRAKTQDQAAEILAEQIARLVDQGGLAPSEITILSPHPYPESAAGALPPQTAAQILPLDEFALRGFPPENISFARIRDFKGLENEAVILIDLPKPKPGTETEVDAYVGMSRARSLLTGTNALAIHDSYRVSLSR